MYKFTCHHFEIMLKKNKLNWQAKLYINKPSSTWTFDKSHLLSTSPRCILCINQPNMQHLPLLFKSHIYKQKLTALTQMVKKASEMRKDNVIDDNWTLKRNSHFYWHFIPFVTKKTFFFSFLFFFKKKGNCTLVDKPHNHNEYPQFCGKFILLTEVKIAWQVWLTR